MQQFRPPAPRPAEEITRNKNSFFDIRNVSKTFISADGRETAALRPVDLQIEKGQFVSLVGPSGCGKTTLLKIASGLIEPTSGEVLLDGQSDEIEPNNLGMVFQSPALLPWRTLLRNVLLPAEVMGLDRKTMTKRAYELLELVHLSGREGKYPFELSGGMQQRASIARALLHDPELLFMDEPFGALDAMTRERLNDELHHIHLASQKTVLFVTHSIDEAVFLSDRIVVFSQGPGEVLADVAVDLPTPRTAKDRASAEVRDLEAHIRELLNDGPTDQETRR